MKKANIQGFDDLSLAKTLDLYPKLQRKVTSPNAINAVRLSKSGIVMVDSHTLYWARISKGNTYGLRLSDVELEVEKITYVVSDLLSDEPLNPNKEPMVGVKVGMNTELVLTDLKNDTLESTFYLYLASN